MNKHDRHLGAVGEGVKQKRNGLNITQGESRDLELFTDSEGMQTWEFFCFDCVCSISQEVVS